MGEYVLRLGTARSVGSGEVTSGQGGKPRCEERVARRRELDSDHVEAYVFLCPVTRSNSATLRWTVREITLCVRRSATRPLFSSTLTLPLRLLFSDDSLSIPRPTKSASRSALTTQLSRGTRGVGDINRPLPTQAVTNRVITGSVPPPGGRKGVTGDATS
ncbi:hypothetical protein MRX96_055827 [Rhipicephalus microplus]